MYTQKAQFKSVTFGASRPERPAASRNINVDSTTKEVGCWDSFVNWLAKTCCCGCCPCCGGIQTESKNTPDTQVIIVQRAETIVTPSTGLKSLSTSDRDALFDTLMNTADYKALFLNYISKDNYEPEKAHLLDLCHQANGNAEVLKKMSNNTDEEAFLVNIFVSDEINLPSPLKNPFSGKTDTTVTDVFGFFDDAVIATFMNYMKVNFAVRFINWNQSR
jgi:hypothetical protein